MDQRSLTASPLNPQFEVAQTLYRLVSEALMPSYQIKKHLVLPELNNHGPCEQGVSAGFGSNRKEAGIDQTGMVTGSSIRLFKDRIARQQQMLDQNLEFIIKLLGKYDQPSITPFILDVCPTIKEITAKPYGTGLLKAMGVLTGLALALAIDRKGRWFQFKTALDTGKKSCVKTGIAADRLLELAKRHPEDRLLEEVVNRITRMPVTDIARLLIDFTKMSHAKNTATCRLYLEEFTPALLWPVYPVQGYWNGSAKTSADRKAKMERQHPGVEVIADRLFGKESAKALFAGGDSSKSWDDAGRGFAKVLKAVVGDAPTLVE